MSNGKEILIAVIVAVFLTFCITHNFFKKNEIVGTHSDTTTTTTTKITTSENVFTAVHVGKIKKMLIDSLDAVYKNKLAKLLTTLRRQTADKPISTNSAEGKERNDSDYVFVSEIDTNFVAHDSSGAVTDSMNVKSTVISKEPLPESLIHLLMINHKSFYKETETSTTIKTIKIVEQKRSWIDRFQIRPNVSVGVGIFTKTFDAYAGVGISYEL